MTRGLWILLFVAGCSNSTLHLANREALNRYGPTTLLALHDLDAIRGQVTDVSLPLFRSPSISGDKATLTARVPRGAIPGQPNVSSVALKYDCDGGMRDVEEGSTITLLFVADGRFYGVLEWTTVTVSNAQMLQLKLLDPSSGGDHVRPPVTP